MTDLTFHRVKHIRSGRTAIIISQSRTAVRVRFDDGIRDEANGINGEQSIKLDVLNKQWRQAEEKTS